MMIRCCECEYFLGSDEAHTVLCAKENDQIELSPSHLSECSLGKLKILMTPEIRTFSTGATRDTAEGKLSYVKGLSPIVLRRYLQYLAKHRKQPDGSMREFDNWKYGIPKHTYLDSLGRHFVDLWLLMQGFDATDNHGPCDLEELLCAIIFNSSGLLHEVLKEKK